MLTSTLTRNLIRWHETSRPVNTEQCFNVTDAVISCFHDNPVTHVKIPSITGGFSAAVVQGIIKKSARPVLINDRHQLMSLRQLGQNSALHSERGRCATLWKLTSLRSPFLHCHTQTLLSVSHHPITLRPDVTLQAPSTAEWHFGFAQRGEGGTGWMKGPSDKRRVEAF